MRYACGAGVLAGAALGAGAFAPPAACGEPEPPRPAIEVVVRGKTVLEDAFRTALPVVAPGAAPPDVVVVLDVTPHTRARVAEVAREVSRLTGDASAAGTVRVAALGQPPGRALETPAQAEVAWKAVLAKDTAAPSTVAALRKAMGAFGPEGGVLVYLADWRFEDDADLEAAIEFARRHKVTVSTIGTEAAFLRGWVDGFRSPWEHVNDIRGLAGPYRAEVGRNPFGASKPDAPWHGGETAYPPLPYRWSDFWAMEFDADAGESLEDLRERLPEGAPSVVPDLRKYPLPSAFGPYGLTRLAACTGGRYVLWSWNPKGRRRVTYEYSRCNLFPPDLRSRPEILASLGSDRLGRATIAAWQALASASVRVVDMTPPLTPDLAPRVLEEPAPNQARTLWETPAEHRAFTKEIQEVLRAVRAARRTLEEALAGAAEATDDVARRRDAEARLFAHALAVLEFEAAEAQQAARDVKREAWKDRDRHPGLVPQAFIRGKGDPISSLLASFVTPPRDAAAGEAIRRERTAFLERFRGTPFGAQVEMNDVDTYVVSEYVRGKPVDLGRTPSESGGKTPFPSPVPGGSGGGGPTTGK